MSKYIYSCKYSLVKMINNNYRQSEYLYCDFNFTGLEFHKLDHPYYYMPHSIIHDPVLF